MVTALVVAVEPSLLVPLHPETSQPEAGKAVMLTASPAWYWPVEHPTELEGDAVGSEPEPLWFRVNE